MQLGNIPAVDPFALPPERFEALIARIGQRVAWRKSHACPCTFAGLSGTFGDLTTPGSPQKSCQTCLGLGFYWDTPSLPFRVSMTFMHLAPSPDEPGVITDEKFGQVATSEPSLTIPYKNPYLEQSSPMQPTEAWTNASTDDVFVALDMLSRFTAVLYVDGQQTLPYQDNLQIAPSGAVTIWNTTTHEVVTVPHYSVDGPTVIVSGYAPGTGYMVEFQAAASFVAYRRAGGLPHIRPLDGGAANEPRRFRLQTLDFWSRQRGIQSPVAGTTFTGGQSSTPIQPVGRAFAF